MGAIGLAAFFANLRVKKSGLVNEIPYIPIIILNCCPVLPSGLLWTYLNVRNLMLENYLSMLCVY